MEGASVVLVELEVVTAVVVSAAVEVKLVLVGSSSFASPETQYSVSSSKSAQSRIGLRGLRSPAAMPQLSAKVSQVSPILGRVLELQSTPRCERLFSTERAGSNSDKRAKARAEFPYILTM